MPVALTARQVELASDKDPEITRLRQRILSGNWSRCKMSIYLCVKEERCVLRKLVLLGSRIVIPESLRGDQGIVK